MSSTTTTFDSYPAVVAAWAQRNQDLLRGIVALRRMGTDASCAVEEVLRTAPLERVRLGVELWMAAVSDEGGDPHVRLAEHLPSPDREVLTAALWD